MTWTEETKGGLPPGLFSLAVARSPLLNRRGFHNEDRDSATRLWWRVRCGVNGREPRYNRVTLPNCQHNNNDKVAAMFIDNLKWSAQHLATAAAAMSASGGWSDQGWFMPLRIQSWAGVCMSWTACLLWKWLIYTSWKNFQLVLSQTHTNFSLQW